MAIELCSGILPATLALKKSGLSSKTFFSEIASDPVEVTSAHWPEAIPIGDMRSLDSFWLNKVVAEHPDSLFWITAGVPCKDVSFLNTNRSGALGKHSDLQEVVALIHLTHVYQKLMLILFVRVRIIIHVNDKKQCNKLKHKHLAIILKLMHKKEW